MAHLLATDRDMFYRVAGGPYDVVEDDVPMMLEAIAPQVNFGSSAELETWLGLLSKCTTWEDLDDLQLPGVDFDPAEEPEGTMRVSGSVASLLSDQSQISPCDLTMSAELALDQLAEYWDACQSQLSEEAGTKTPPCASNEA